MAYLTFQALPQANMDALRTIWAELRHDKKVSGGDLRPDDEWIPFFPFETLATFNWPESNRSEWASWLAHWSIDVDVAKAWNTTSAPADRLEPGWSVLALLDSFRNGDYQFGEMESLGPMLYRVTLDNYYPSGGIDALTALVEAFGGWPVEWCNDVSPVIRREQ